MLEIDKAGNTRQALHIDPLRMCQPIGAIYAALGVQACMPHSHGSSGCCRYHKILISKHFQKTIRVTSSMLKENAAIFGGEENLKAAVKTIFDIYKPQIIAVHSTCLSETIGDHVSAILSEIELPTGKYLVSAQTPSYLGSHLTGYANMVEALLDQLAVRSELKRKKCFIIPGLVNPSDIREIKEIAASFNGEFTVCPDISDVFDAATPEKQDEYSPGGTPLSEIIAAGSCELVLALGAEAAGAPAAALSEKCDIPFATLDLPIGIEATDRYIRQLQLFFGSAPLVELKRQRAQLVETVMNCHPLLYKKRAAVFCDPDIAVPLCEFLAGIGMAPAFVFTGPASGELDDRLQEIFRRYETKGVVQSNTDLFELEQYLNNETVDVLIGEVHGKHLARRLDIPFVRMGFPITDRFIHPYFPIVGYRGALRILEMLLNAILDRADRDRAAEELSFML
ncbi:MAG: nitrogenase component 1 [Desulfosporosinus sp.]|nr:nitrogenase component 1 [Desulfosporosinus sp.]